MAKEVTTESMLEHVLTHSYKADMIAYMKHHPDDFDELIKLALADKHPFSWRAAWLLWSLTEEDDKRIQRYAADIVDSLPNRNDNQQRELLLVLQRLNLADEWEGKLFGICIAIWEKTGKQPSVRFNAFKLIIKIVKRHPELSKEIDFLTEPQYMVSLSDTVGRSVHRMIAGLG